MKRKLMAGFLVAAMGIGVLIGVNTIGSSQAASDSADPAAKTMLSVQEAKQIALAQVYGGGRIESAELERDDGKVFYEVEIDTRDMDYEIDVDAYSGLILGTDKDRERDDDRRKATQPARSSDTAYISLEQAVAIATNKTPGRVVETEREWDDGRLYYEIEIDTNQGEAEIEVDARTGDIMSVEYDD